MLDFLKNATSDDAIVIIKHDHDKVKHLFEQFENTEDLRRKKKIVAEAIMELKIHAEIEEKIFYPSVRKGVEEDLMNEADEEHHVAKLLIAELEQMEASDDHWEAKFTVLSENIRHHIKEEEGDMLPQARKMDLDFKVIGQKIMKMKEDLKKNGIPPCDEEKLMTRGFKADSPAKAAKAKSSAKVLSHKSAKKSASAKKTMHRNSRKAS
jgi:hypothetical protein